MANIALDEFDGGAGTMEGRTPAPTQPGANTWSNINGATFDVDGSGAAFCSALAGDDHGSVRLDCDVADGAIIVPILTRAAGNPNQGACFNFTDTNNRWYAAAYDEGSGGVYALVKVEGGSYTNPAGTHSITLGNAASHTIKAIVSGDRIVTYYDGVEQDDFTEVGRFNKTEEGWGLEVYLDIESLFNEFQVTDEAPPPAIAIPVIVNCHKQQRNM